MANKPGMLGRPELGDAEWIQAAFECAYDLCRQQHDLADSVTSALLALYAKADRFTRSRAHYHRACFHTEMAGEVLSKGDDPDKHNALAAEHFKASYVLDPLPETAVMILGLWADELIRLTEDEVDIYLDLAWSTTSRDRPRDFRAGRSWMLALILSRAGWSDAADECFRTAILGYDGPDRFVERGRVFLDMVRQRLEVDGSRSAARTIAQGWRLLKELAANAPPLRERIVRLQATALRGIVSRGDLKQLRIAVSRLDRS